MGKKARRVFCLNVLKTKRKKNRIKSRRYLRRHLKNFRSFARRYRLRRRKFNRRLTIKITSNNVFCSLSSLVTNKVLIVCSAGKYRIKTTKKRIKYTHRRVLLIFLSKAWKFFNRGGILAIITAPIRLRKKIIRFISPLRFYRPRRKHLKKRPLLIKVQDKKCFNGCRSKKRRRKKRKNRRLSK